ncbi:hypothetical protein GGI43DRAFT_427793 [Trichoderma evansii]
MNFFGLKATAKKQKQLFVPNVFKDGDSVFLMSATHRGDMYHFRAALQLKKDFSVVLYGSNRKNNGEPKTKDLEDYLAETVLKNKKHIFVVPWEYEVLNGDKPLPTKFDDCYLDNNLYHGKDIQKHGLLTYSESESTGLIANIANAPERLKDIAEGMAIVSNALNDEKSAKYKELTIEFNKIWTRAGIVAEKNTILFMYRDTGTKDPGPSGKLGVYPELDTGNAIGEIEKIVGDIEKSKEKAITIVSCGLQGSGIGEYWIDLRKLNPSPETITSRDFEAYFLKWSFKHGYYKMASGFRSGPLDLFTFMGIPTVSIGLRNLMGETRHQLLARKEFKRVNIQYDQPRHQVTAAVGPGRETPQSNQAKKDQVKKDQPKKAPTKKEQAKEQAKKEQTLFGSPFWEFSTPEGGEERKKPKELKEKKDAQTKPPGPFAPFDKIVIEIGYRFACALYMNLTQSVHNLDEPPTCTINTRVARLCYPNGTNKEKKEYVEKHKAIDLQDYEKMKNNKDLQQSEDMVAKYKKDLDDDWEKMKNFSF